MALHTDDIGKLIIVDAEFDMEDNTELRLVFTKPDGTLVEKVKADGVNAPSVDFSQTICGVLVEIPAYTYFQYPTESGFLDQEGLWSVHGEYVDSTPKDFAGTTATFTVLPRD